MKLLCINNKPIDMFSTYGGLKEGKIYETNGEPFMKLGEMMYYIEGKGAFLCCRFTKVIEPVKEEVIWSKKEEFSLN